MAGVAEAAVGADAEGGCLEGCAGEADVVGGAEVGAAPPGAGGCADGASVAGCCASDCTGGFACVSPPAAGVASCGAVSRDATSLNFGHGAGAEALKAVLWMAMEMCQMWLGAPQVPCR